MNIGIIAVGITMLGVIGGGIGIGIIGKALLDAIARNPQVADKAMTYAIIGMALAEATAIYCFVIAFMLLGKF